MFSIVLHIQFSTNTKMYSKKMKTSLGSPEMPKSRATNNAMLYRILIGFEAILESIISQGFKEIRQQMINLHFLEEKKYFQNLPFLAAQVCLVWAVQLEDQMTVLGSDYPPYSWPGSGEWCQDQSPQGGELASDPNLQLGSGNLS